MPVIWGKRVVTEALRSHRTVRKVYFATRPTESNGLAEIEGLARRNRVTAQTLDRKALDRLADTDRHQGVAADIIEYSYATVDDLLAEAQKRNEKPLILALDQLQDPQNLGTLIRTAEAVGAHGVVVPRHRAAGVTPAVERASAGAIEHLLVAETPNLNRMADDLKKQGVWIVGLDAEGDQPYDKVDGDMPICLVVGSEGKGISQLLREKCDLLVKLPMRGKVGSLNAAVAGSIVLYEIWRKRAGSL